MAVRGLSRINGELSIPELLPFLRDISPRVVREVRKAIGRYPSAIDGEELLAAALEAPGLYARRNAITLIAELGKWRCLPWLLAIASSANVEDAEFAEEKIREWFTPPKWNKVFTAPSSDAKQNILSALEKAKGRVSEETIELAKLGLKQFN
ncbi:hypothetical protein [Planctomicrobium piriforme]|uniref:hypothetical protein n=1 Tax=Planctomicrobium piriforme TaxID=1576369 RepID=UPI001113CA5D|nr:hypothetical protein [Planctomicrobium piriforme]